MPPPLAASTGANRVSRSFSRLKYNMYHARGNRIQQERWTAVASPSYLITSGRERRGSQGRLPQQSSTSIFALFSARKSFGRKACFEYPPLRWGNRNPGPFSAHSLLIPGCPWPLRLRRNRRTSSQPTRQEALQIEGALPIGSEILKSGRVE